MPTLFCVALFSPRDRGVAPVLERAPTFFIAFSHFTWATDFRMSATFPVNPAFPDAF